MSVNKLITQNMLVRLKYEIYENQISQKVSYKQCFNNAYFYCYCIIGINFSMLLHFLTILKIVKSISFNLFFFIWNRLDWTPPTRPYFRFVTGGSNCMGAWMLRVLWSMHLHLQKLTLFVIFSDGINCYDNLSQTSKDDR